MLRIGGDVFDDEDLRDFARTYDDPADGFAATFEPAASLWRADEDAFVIVNLEVPVADERRFAHDASRDRGGRRRRVLLRGAPWICEGLAGDVVGVFDDLDEAHSSAASPGRGRW